MHDSSGGALILFVFAFLLSMRSLQHHAYGHKPLETAGGINNNLKDSLLIPDHEISWAIYQNLSIQNPVLFYKFDAQTGEELYVQLSIPQLSDLKHYNPRLVLIGFGVSESILTEATSTDVVAHDMNFPTPLDEHYGIISLNYQQGSEMKEVFYEPFTQTSYWEKQQFRAILPNDGRYYLAVYVDDLSELKGSSKFTLAVGEIEDFQPVDFVTTLPLAWFSTKLFFEDYLSILVVILTPIALLAAYIARRLVRKAAKQNHKT